ncbi:MAG: DHHA1 domain-containing protein, partial [Pseudanabaenaceae cyanobacterium bins.68]|nr:DHHA1 domain-containing protein [Pseudanabaenaceae cyanobacterium bins.68]
IEAQINQWILECHGARVAVMPIGEAKAKGAIAMFGEKYGEQVRVIDFPGVSLELCGGTHVQNTAEIGLFKIISESGVAAGIRRIEGVAGQAVNDYLQVRDQITKELSDRFKVKPDQILERVNSLQAELKNTQKQVESLKQAIALNSAEQLLSGAEQVGKFQVLVAELPDLEADGLKTAAEMLLRKLTHGAVVLGSAPQSDRVNLVAAFSGEVNAKGVQAGKLIGAIAKITGGGGGGRSNFAQAGGKDASKLGAALEQAAQELKQKLLINS